MQESFVGSAVGREKSDLRSGAQFLKILAREVG